MRFWLGTLFQRNAHSPLRRAYFALLRRFRAVFSKRQSVHFVRINGKRYKRVALGDSFEASNVEQALHAAPDAARFPPLIQRHENELLLAFVEGRRFDPARAGDVDDLARFLGALYSVDRVGRPSSVLRGQLEIDLRFLCDAEVIDTDLEAAVLGRAEEVQPGEVEYGLDYVDPVAKNFVVGDRGLYAIDVESLRQDVPVGTSVAKAGLHWLAREDLQDFLAVVERHSGDVFREQYAFVELCFRAGWIKRKLLQGKQDRVRASALSDVFGR